MDKKLSAYLIVIALLVFLVFPAPAKAASNSYVSSRALKDTLLGTGGGNIKAAVKTALDEGFGAKDVVMTAILLGYDACVVVKCAISGGGNLGEVISGAVESGVTSDVVSKCCIDAGVDPFEIARGLQTESAGLGYSPPEDGSHVIPPSMIAPPAPSISPHRF